MGRSLGASRAKSACAWRTLTTFPSSFFQRTPVVAGATDCLGRAPHNLDGPTKAHISPATREGDRHPVDQGAFHRCDCGHVKGSLLFVFPSRPPAHAAHMLSPWLGAICFSDIASVAVGTSPATTSREQDAFTTSLRGFLRIPLFAPGPDDPSTPTWLGVKGRWRQLIAAVLPPAPQRLDGFYDREPAA